MPSSDEYKRQIMSDLARGNVESLGNIPADPTTEYQSFDDFAQRSTQHERREMFGKSLHPDQIPTSQMEPELQKAIEKIKPNERHNVARSFFKYLQPRGLSDRYLEQQLTLSTCNPHKMTAEDVSKLAAFAYHNHPDIFQEVLAEQPSIMKFLSNPIVGAVLGIAATKWLGNHRR